MRRIRLLFAVAALAATLLPVATAHGQAVPGDYIELSVAYRGQTPWISSAVINLAVEPIGDGPTLRLSDGSRTAVAEHPAPSGAFADTFFDLTDAAPIRTDVPFTVELEGYGEATIEAAHLAFGSPAGTVTGKGPAGTDLDVTLDSGDQLLTRTVTTGADGSFVADFTDEFDGSWEFGATVATVVESSTSDGVSVDVLVEQRLPSADIQQFITEVDGVEQRGGQLGVVTELTPGVPATVFDGPTTVTEQTVVRELPSGEATVRHLGQRIALRPVSELSVDAYDFEADSATGMAPAGAEVVVAATVRVGTEATTTVTAGDDGAWSADLAAEGLDATDGVVVDASVVGEDLARYHAQRVFGAQQAVFGEAIALLTPATEQLALLLPGDVGATYEVAATTPSATGRLTATGSELAAGVTGEDFEPPIELTAGLDVTARSDDRSVVVRVPALTWRITASGDVEGTTDPGVTLTVVDDAPIAGVESGEVTSGEDGSFSFDSAVPAVAGRRAGLFAVVPTPETSSVAILVDEQRTLAREHELGAEGGRAPGHGSVEELPDEIVGLLAAFATPVSWEMDADVAAGGAEDLTVQLPPPVRDEPLDEQVVIGPYTVRVRENGAAVERPSAQLDVMIPLVGYEASGGASSLTVAQREDDAWVSVDGQVTFCLDGSSTLPAGCDRFPLPYVLVEDVPAGEYAVVSAAAEGRVTVQRIAGPNRIATAVAVSRDTFAPGGPQAAVVAAAEDFPDALAAAPLAAASSGPVLLNPRDRLDDAVADELQRLGTRRVFLMGGTSAQSREVEEAIAALDTVDEVVRVSGPDRFATAAAAAKQATELWRAQGDAAAGTQPLIALGTAFPDALSAGPLAAASRQPILLVARDVAPASTRAALDDLGADRVSVIGGTGAIPASTADQLGRPVDRLSGPDRYATAARVADAALAAGASAAQVLIATGLTFPDGLAAGPAAAARGGVVLLVDAGSLDASASTGAWLDVHADALAAIRVIGGPAAVSDRVLSQLRARVGAS